MDGKGQEITKTIRPTKYLGLWSNGLRKFFEKFVKPSGTPSYIFNVHCLIEQLLF